MDIIRAWKDEAYRNSLSEAERAALPENPAGSVELSDEDMQIAVGGTYHTKAVPCRTVIKGCVKPTNRAKEENVWISSEPGKTKSIATA